jgi:hypothetical protein
MNPKYNRFFRLACLMVFAPHLALAQASGGQYHEIGSGTASCGAWTADRHQLANRALSDEEWVLGFLSGVGYIGYDSANPLNKTDADGVWAWIDNYCSAHPISQISDAAAAFYHAHPD